MELFAARLEGSRINVAALGEAAGLAPTTALRWLGLLQDRGLITRRRDPASDRNVRIDLTDAAEDILRAYLVAALRLSPWVA